MRPSSRRVILFFLALAFILTSAIAPLRAQTSVRPPFPLEYVLSPDSRYESGCFEPCMCPILIQDAVKGGFTLSFSGFE